MQNSLIWDRIDLQSMLRGVQLPHLGALNACPMAWQSLPVHLCLILNGYAKESADADRLLNQWLKYDLLVIHWQNPEQIAWSLFFVWRLRLISTSPRVVLWGRHTSYGRDVSSDLHLLRGHSIFARLFDAIIADAGLSALQGIITFFENGNKSSLKETLLVEDYRFVRYHAPETHLDLLHQKPDGSDFGIDNIRWSGNGLPDQLQKPTAYINWQARDPGDFIRGIERISKWKFDGKKLFIETPANYPWLNRSQNIAIRKMFGQIPGRIQNFHVYKPEAPLDLCDSISAVEERA
jgi:hypothetical protein